MYNKQNASSLLGINNTIQQYINNYENRELLTHLLESELDKIELFLKERNIEEARSQIDTILYKREKLPEEIECRLIFLKGNIENVLGNLSGVNSIIKSLQEKEEGKKFSLELKYSSAIMQNDEDLMNECIDGFISDGEDEIDILKRQMWFYLNNKNFNEVIKRAKHFEEDQIKDGEVFYYMAVSYLYIEEYEKAIQNIDKAIELSGSLSVLTYVKILVEINPILKRKGILVSVSDEEKTFLREKGSVLKELIRELPDDLIQEVLIILINLYLIIDLDEGIRLYEENREKLNNSIESKYLRANIYKLSNEFENAKKEYLEIIEQNWSEEVMRHIMFCMRATEDHINYIRIYEENESKIEDDEFLLSRFYLESLENLGYLDKTRKKLEEFKMRHINTLGFKIYLAKVKEDKNEKIELLREAEEMIMESNQDSRILINEIYMHEEMFEDAIRVVSPLFKYKEILAGMVEMFIGKEKKAFYLRLITEIDKHNDIKLLKYKKRMLEEIDELFEAKNVAEDIYKLEKDRENLIELILLKIRIEDADNLDNLLLESMPLENPNEYMIISLGYILLGNMEKYNSYSYEAVFRLRGTFDEFIFRNYVSSKLRLISKGKIKDVKLDLVVEESVAVLIDKFEEIKVCLNSELKYQINEMNFGCLHIAKGNPLWLEILNQGVGDKVCYNHKELIIDRILEKDVALFQYCLNELTLRKIDFGLVSVSIEDLEEKMKRINIKDEESFNTKIDAYNSQEGIGLPFSKVFFGENIIKSIAVLQYFLLNQENSYYCGTPDIVSGNNVYVLSYQTLLLLEHYNILDIIQKDSGRYFVSNLVQSKIMETIFELKKNKTSLFMNYDQKIGLYSEEIDNNLMFEKLKSIMETINDLESLMFDYKIRDKLTNMSRKLINDYDVETIYLAKEVKGTLIIDDFFIRKLISSNESIKDIKHTNIGTLLNILYKDDATRYISIIKKMIGNNIKYVLNTEYFQRLMLEYKKYGYDQNWFRELIDDMQNDDYYKTIMISACKEVVALELHGSHTFELSYIAKSLNLI